MTVPANSSPSSFSEEARIQLLESVSRLKHCLQQLDERQLWWRPHPSLNSVANLVLHLCGNVRQRIGSVVGGAPDIRERDREFSAEGPISQAELIRRLDDAANVASNVLATVTDTELAEHRTYPGVSRTFDESVRAVILRTLLHFAGHSQEVVLLTRMQLGEAYAFLGPPPI